MDDLEETTERERIDPMRTLFLGLCTTVLAIAFLLLLIGDTVTATTF
jgi:hypothetical protein